MKNQMFLDGLTLFLGLLTVISAQQIGTFTPEVHPLMSISSCKAVIASNTSSLHGIVPSQCEKEQTSLVLDANWRWIHQVNDYTSCLSGSSWNPALCPDPATCAKNCALEGADYHGVYGVDAHDQTAELKFKVNSNVGSRVYLLEGSKYKQFKLKNREFSFDVDVSQLPCGLNGAVYFVEMPADGGAYQSGNNAGAAYGTGYCDAQCPKDLKFVQGEANSKDGLDFSSGGHYGSCCTEIDLWEANTMATAYTTHGCDASGLQKCEGATCSSVCDTGGCDHNPFRTGSPFFYGPGIGYSLDSTKDFTVVTQFITEDGSDTGDLKEIKRFYVQNGKVIENPALQFGAATGLNSLSDAYCASEAALFSSTDVSASKGGLAAIGRALDRGVVLTLSVWDDHSSNMLWLDSVFPPGMDASKPGVARGSCPTTSGKPADVESQYPDAVVKYMNIKYGTIGSTFGL